MSEPIRTTTPTGEPIVILSAADYDRLVAAAEDRRDAALADAALAAHRDDPSAALDPDEMRQLLAAPTPLAFWRRRRGLTQEALAGKAGITQSYLAYIEAGKRDGTMKIYGALAAALGLAIDDLAPAVDELAPK